MPIYEVLFMVSTGLRLLNEAALGREGTPDAHSQRVIPKSQFPEGPIRAEHAR